MQVYLVRHAEADWEGFGKALESSMSDSIKSRKGIGNNIKSGRDVPLSQAGKEQLPQIAEALIKDLDKRNERGEVIMCYGPSHRTEDTANALKRAMNSKPNMPGRQISSIQLAGYNPRVKGKSEKFGTLEINTARRALDDIDQGTLWPYSREGLQFLVHKVEAGDIQELTSRQIADARAFKIFDHMRRTSGGEGWLTTRYPAGGTPGDKIASIEDFVRALESEIKEIYPNGKDSKGNEPALVIVTHDFNVRTLRMALKSLNAKENAQHVMAHRHGHRSEGKGRGRGRGKDRHEMENDRIVEEYYDGIRLHPSVPAGSIWHLSGSKFGALEDHGCLFDPNRKQAAPERVPTRIYLGRHCEAMTNSSTEENRIAARRHYHENAPLTTDGKLDCIALANDLNEQIIKSGYKGELVIVHSPYLRAAQTAERVAEILRGKGRKEPIRLIRDKRLVELNNGSFRLLTASQRIERFGDVAREYERIRKEGTPQEKYVLKAPYGESAEMVEKRVRKMVKDIESGTLRGVDIKGKHIVIISHDLPMRAAGKIFLNETPEWYMNQPSPPNGSLWLLEGGDHAHLRDRGYVRKGEGMARSVKTQAGSGERMR